MEYTGFFPGAACCHLIELGHPIKRLPSSAPEQFRTLEQKTDFDDEDDYDTEKNGQTCLIWPFAHFASTWSG